MSVIATPSASPFNSHLHIVHSYPIKFPTVACYCWAYLPPPCTRPLLSLLLGYDRSQTPPLHIVIHPSDVACRISISPSHIPHLHDFRVLRVPRALNGRGATSRPVHSAQLLELRLRIRHYADNYNFLTHTTPQQCSGYSFRADASEHTMPSLT